MKVQEKYDKSSALLKVFDDGIHLALSPFMSSYNAKESIGKSIFSQYPGPSDIQLVEYLTMDRIFFWWIHRFELKNTILDIGFGDKEFIVEPMLYYKGIKDRFAPWEILSAASVTNPHVASGEMWVGKINFMRDVIKNMTTGLKEHWVVLANPSSQIIDRALVLRGKRMIFAQEEQRKIDREKACIKAMEFFHAGKYAEAIKLIEPFKNDADLSRSASMMYGMAQKKNKGHK